MPFYEVTFPIIRGYEVITVEASDEDEAIEQALLGNIVETDYARLETDFDSNLAEVAKIEGT